MYLTIKRWFDVIFSLLGLLVISPFLLIIVLILKFTGEGEVFYRQERVGYKNKTFGILKFATMLKDSPNIGNGLVTTRNDARITPFGKLLRISKVNELPQIWNVFVGDMSFVGPRPLPKSSVSKYNVEVQAIIYQHRPGITGIGSLLFRDEEKLVTVYKNKGLDPLDYYKEYIYPYKGALETWYFKNISFWKDLTILFLTFWTIIKSDSQLIYSVFKSLPQKPQELSVTWIENSSHNP